jgi:hypothetical protein
MLNVSLFGDLIFYIGFKEYPLHLSVCLTGNRCDLLALPSFAELVGIPVRGLRKATTPQFILTNELL